MSGAQLTRLAGYLSGRPLYMEPSHVKAALDALGPRLGLALEASDEPGQTMAERKRAAAVQRLASIVEAEPVYVGDGMGEYAVTEGGVAVISVVGTLVSRFDWLAAWCGIQSYDGIGLTLDAAIADPRVRAILLDVDSPGGEAAGMLDLADKVRAASAIKPVWASANSLAASAAYGIAAAARRLTVPRLGAVGSIGVVAVHIDQSARDKAEGLRFTALHSGARKVDGWGHAPLAAEARERFQAQLDAAREKFAGAVAGFRGLTPAAVLATEAAVYDDEEGVSAGLADAVASFADTLAELTDEVRPTGGPFLGGTAARTNGKGDTMPKESKAADSQAADDNGKEEVGDGAPGEDGGQKDDGYDKVARADAAAIVTACADAGLPRLAAALIQEGATLDQAKARIDAAGKIRAAVDTAHKVNAGAVPLSFADELIDRNATVEEAKAACMDKLVSGQSPEIDASVPADEKAAADAPVIDTAAIYARRGRKPTAR